MPRSCSPYSDLNCHGSIALTHHSLFATSTSVHTIFAKINTALVWGVWFVCFVAGVRKKWCTLIFLIAKNVDRNPLFFFFWNRQLRNTEEPFSVPPHPCSVHHPCFKINCQSVLPLRPGILWIWLLYQGAFVLLNGQLYCKWSTKEQNSACSSVGPKPGVSVML